MKSVIIIGILLSVSLLAQQTEVILKDSWYIPHLTQPDGGFETQLLLENPTDFPLAFQVHAFNAHGEYQIVHNTSNPSWGSLAPHTLEKWDMASFIQTGVKVDWIRIDMLNHWSPLGDKLNTNIHMSAIYQRTGGGTPVEVPMTRQVVSSARIMPGNWSEAFDGLALVNVSKEAIHVELQQVDYQDQVVQTLLLADALQPYNKILHVIGSPSGSEFEERFDVFYRVQASGNFVLTALRGTDRNIWGMNALAIGSNQPGILDLGFSETTLHINKFYPLNLEIVNYFKMGFRYERLEGSTFKDGPETLTTIQMHTLEENGELQEIELLFEYEGTYQIQFFGEGLFAPTEKTIQVKVNP